MDDQYTPTWIIAEVGVNHNGDIHQAKALIDVAIEAGCDSVKFQVFNPLALTTTHAEQAHYQRENGQANQSQQALLTALSLPPEDFFVLQQYAEERQISFLATPFDIANLVFLTDQLKCQTIKIGSGDLTDGPLLLAAARRHRNIILSTGMATLSEIEQALSLLAFGYCYSEQDPTAESILRAYISPEGQALLGEHVTLLHCCSQYPALASQVNLLAMSTLQRTFQLPVGYSDHSTGIAIPIAAAALGACIIEKHITLDKSLPGPDHRASLEPDELTAMVAGIREVETALGHGRKLPLPAELTMRQFARKSIVANGSVQRGEIYQEKHLTAKRPGTGISPMQHWQLLDKLAVQNFADDDLITME